MDGPVITNIDLGQRFVSTVVRLFENSAPRKPLATEGSEPATQEPISQEADISCEPETEELYRRVYECLLCPSSDDNLWAFRNFLYRRCEFLYESFRINYKTHKRIVQNVQSSNGILLGRLTSLREAIDMDSHPLIGKSSWRDPVQYDIWKKASIAKLNQRIGELSKQEFGGTLYIGVIKSSNILPVDITGMDLRATSADPYVLITLVKSKKTEKTEIKHRCLQPSWNQFFEFPITAADEVIQLNLKDFNVSTLDKELGTVYIPIRSFRDGQVHTLPFDFMNPMDPNVVSDYSSITAIQAAYESIKQNGSYETTGLLNKINLFNAQPGKKVTRVTLGGTVTLCLHFVQRDSSPKPMIGHSLPNFREDIYKLIELFMESARWRTPQGGNIEKGAISLPDDCRILLEDYCLRYGFGDYAVEVAYVKWVIQDFMKRTSPKLTPANSRKNSFIHNNIDLSVSSTGLGESYYLRIELAIIKFREVEKYLTSKEVDDIREAMRRLDSHLQSMIANFSESMLTKKGTASKSLISALNLQAKITGRKSDEHVKFLTECFQRGIDAKIRRIPYEMVPGSSVDILIFKWSALVHYELNACYNLFNNLFVGMQWGTTPATIIPKYLYSAFAEKLTEYCAQESIDVHLSMKLYLECKEINAIISKHPESCIENRIPLIQLFRYHKKNYIEFFKSKAVSLLQSCVEKDDLKPIENTFYSTSVVDAFRIFHEPLQIIRLADFDSDQIIDYVKQVMIGNGKYIEMLNKRMQSFQKPSPDKEEGKEKVAVKSSIGGIVVNTVSTIGYPIVWVATGAASGVSRIVTGILPGQQKAAGEAEEESVPITLEMCILINDATKAMDELHYFFEDISTVPVFDSDRELFLSELAKQKDISDQEMTKNRGVLIHTFVAQINKLIQADFRQFFDAPSSSKLGPAERLRAFTNDFRGLLPEFSKYIAKFSEIVLDKIWESVIQCLELCCTDPNNPVFVIKSASEANLVISAMETLWDYFKLNGKGLDIEYLESSSEKVLNVLLLFSLPLQELFDLYFMGNRQEANQVSQKDIIHVMKQRDETDLVNRFLAQIDEKKGAKSVEPAIRKKLGIPPSELDGNWYMCSYEGESGWLYIFSGSIGFCSRDGKKFFKILLYEVESISIETSIMLRNGIMKITKDRQQTSSASSLELTSFVSNVNLKKAADEIKKYHSLLKQGGKKQESETSLVQRSYSLNLFTQKLEGGNSVATRDLFGVPHSEKFFFDTKKYPCKVDRTEACIFIYYDRICIYAESLVSSTKTVISHNEVKEITGYYSPSCLEISLLLKNRTVAIQASIDSDLRFYLLKFWKRDMPDPEGEILSESCKIQATQFASKAKLPSVENIIMTTKGMMGALTKGDIVLTKYYICWTPFFGKRYVYILKHVESTKFINETLSNKLILLMADESTVTFTGVKNGNILDLLINRRLRYLGKKVSTSDERQVIDEYERVLYRETFGINDPDEVLRIDNCRHGPIRGKLWVGTLRLCFSPLGIAAVFGNKIIIPYSEVKEVFKVMDFQTIPAIDVRTETKEFRFSDVSNRDELCDIISQHTRCNESASLDEAVVQDLREKFQLDANERYVRYFSCIRSDINAPGYLYVTTNHLCFVSMFKIQSHQKKYQFREIQKLELTKTFGLFPTQITFLLANGKRHSFHGFINRDEAASAITDQAGAVGVSFLGGFAVRE